MFEIGGTEFFLRQRARLSYVINDNGVLRRASQTNVMYRATRDYREDRVFVPINRTAQATIAGYAPLGFGDAGLDMPLVTFIGAKSGDRYCLMLQVPAIPFSGPQMGVTISSTGIHQGDRIEWHSRFGLTGRVAMTAHQAFEIMATEWVRGDALAEMRHLLRHGAYEGAWDAEESEFQFSHQVDRQKRPFSTLSLPADGRTHDVSYASGLFLVGSASVHDADDIADDSFYRFGLHAAQGR
jgi:hypothetical protein